MFLISFSQSRSSNNVPARILSNPDVQPIIQALRNTKFLTDYILRKLQGGHLKEGHQQETYGYDYDCMCRLDENIVDR